MPATESKNKVAVHRAVFVDAVCADGKCRARVLLPIERSSSRSC